MATPLHTLITTDAVGGVWTYTLQLCRALAKSNVHVSVAVMGPVLQPWQRQEARTLPNVDLYESTFKLEWMDDSDADVDKAGEWLMSIVDRQRVDLVHLNGYMHGALDWRVPSLVVAHSCLISWWDAVKKLPVPAEFDMYRDRVSRGLRNADLVVAPSRAMLSEIERIYGPLEHAIVIPNGRNAREFPAGKKEQIILSTGRLWDEAKNVRVLEKIAPRVPWPIYVAGERVHPNGSNANFRNVVLLGALPPGALQPWFSRAAIYAAPARYEPFGLSALEAALAGCALVLSDIPSFRENWDRAAVFAPPTPEGFESAIVRLAEDEHARRRCASLCASRALQFSSQAMARRYVEAYQLAQQRFQTRIGSVVEERIA